MIVTHLAFDAARDDAVAVSRHDFRAQFDENLQGLSRVPLIRSIKDSDPVIARGGAVPREDYHPWRSTAPLTADRRVAAPLPRA